MRIEDLRRRLREAGAKPCHEEGLLRRWTQQLPPAVPPRHPGDFLPASLLRALPALEADLAALARVQSVHPGGDGAERLLVELGDGQMVESVLLPRDGLCVSTQVGCAVGCTFCMTGRDGLRRQLTSGEIVAQVALGRARRRVRKVVFMGMGEPAHNLDQVLEATDLLGRLGDLGHKNIVVSSVGDRRLFERLPQEHVKPALALSLHTTDAALRRQLLPRAPEIDPDELVALGEDYAQRTGYPIQYQWTLLAGVNDGEAEVEGIVRLLAGKYAVLNLIPYNATTALDYRRPEWDEARALARRLHGRGILTKLRDSAGQDVDGGCGQLRARAAAPLRRARARGDGRLRPPARGREPVAPTSVSSLTRARRAALHGDPPMPLWPPTSQPQAGSPPCASSRSPASGRRSGRKIGGLGRLGHIPALRRAAALAACLCLFALPLPPAAADAETGTRLSRLQALALMQTLQVELLSNASATLTLERWCARRRLATPPVVVADRVPDAPLAATPEIRRLLRVRPEEEVRHRRVQLRCGARPLSVADNWYVPGRLTPAMNRALEQTDTPFGKVVRPLGFRRQVLAAALLWQPLPQGWEEARPNAADEIELGEVPLHLFTHRALLEDADGRPFSLVQETYLRNLLELPPR